jgi:hypothetical protein
MSQQQFTQKPLIQSVVIGLKDSRQVGEVRLRHFSDDSKTDATC